MPRIDAALEQTLRSDPDATQRCIVRTKAPPGAYREVIEGYGLNVVYISTLINAVTVEGPANAILQLCEEHWVSAVESDKPVHTM